MPIIQPLDFQTLFGTYLFGSMTIFFFVAAIVIAFYASKYRMTNGLFLMMIALFFVFMLGLGSRTLLAPFVIAAGFVGGYLLSKVGGQG